MNDSSTLSIVIPVYNEAIRIRDTLLKIKSYAQTRPWITEVLIVVEPSTDGTIEIIQNETRDNQRIKVIANSQHFGKGYAVKTGVLNAKGDWILFMDADLSVSLDQIDPVYARLQTLEHPLAIIGSRYTGAYKPRHLSLLRRMSSRFFKTVFVKMMGLNVSDSQCGFKVFEKNIGKKVFQNLKTMGFAFDIEIILKLKRDGVAILEWPVIWKDSGNSTFSLLHHGTQILRDLIKIKLTII